MNPAEICWWEFLVSDLRDRNYSTPKKKKKKSLVLISCSQLCVGVPSFFSSFIFCWAVWAGVTSNCDEGQIFKEDRGGSQVIISKVSVQKKRPVRWDVWASSPLRGAVCKHMGGTTPACGALTSAKIYLHVYSFVFASQIDNINTKITHGKYIWGLKTDTSSRLC